LQIFSRSKGFNPKIGLLDAASGIRSISPAF
jgi:hypothetical protein